MDTLKLIEEAVLSAAAALPGPERPPRVLAAQDCRPQQLADALVCLTRSCAPSEVAVLADRTGEGSGKEGFLFAADRFYADEEELCVDAFSKRRMVTPVYYRDLAAVQPDPDTPGALCFTFGSGRRETAAVPHYGAFLCAALTAILKALREPGPEPDAAAGGPKKEGTPMKYYEFVMLKPDAVRRGLAEEIVRRLRRGGFTVEQLACKTATAELIRAHYADNIVKYGPDFARRASACFDGQTVLPMLLGSEQADIVARVRALVGATDPQKAARGTIRGDLGVDSFEKSNAEDRMCENLIHASDSDEAVRAEAAVWFDAATLADCF